ncbi:MAG TPA: hypothetical protein H9684_07370 [Firmicutes bacterium]|nr:hypothetical protein [Bacillota bacterium]
MDDLAKKLNDLLNSPDGMQKLQQAAASLGAMMGEGEGDSGAPSAPAPEPPPPEPAPVSSGNDAEGSAGLGDLAAIARLLPLLSDMKSDDENTTLLKALRPYLQSERQQRLDETIKIMHMLKLLPLLGGGGLPGLGKDPPSG